MNVLCCPLHLVTQERHSESPTTWSLQLQKRGIRGRDPSCFPPYQCSPTLSTDSIYLTPSSLTPSPLILPPLPRSLTHIRPMSQVRTTRIKRLSWATNPLLLIGICSSSTAPSWRCLGHSRPSSPPNPSTPSCRPSSIVSIGRIRP